MYICSDHNINLPNNVSTNDLYYTILKQYMVLFVILYMLSIIILPLAIYGLYYRLLKFIILALVLYGIFTYCQNLILNHICKRIQLIFYECIYMSHAFIELPLYENISEQLVYQISNYIVYSIPRLIFTISMTIMSVGVIAYENKSHILTLILLIASYILIVLLLWKYKLLERDNYAIDYNNHYMKNEILNNSLRNQESLLYMTVNNAHYNEMNNIKYLYNNSHMDNNYYFYIFIHLILCIILLSLDYNQLYIIFAFLILFFAVNDICNHHFIAMYLRTNILFKQFTTVLENIPHINTLINSIHDITYTSEHLSFSLNNENTNIVIMKDSETNSIIQELLGANKQITVNNIPLQDIDLTSYRKHIGYLPKYFQLFNNRSVWDNIWFGQHQVQIQSTEELHEIYNTMNEVLKIFDLYHVIHNNCNHCCNCYDKTTLKLTASETQRFGLARLYLLVLFKKVNILMLDEPISQCNSYYQDLIEKLLLNLMHEYDTKMIILTHEPLAAWNDNEIDL